MASGPSQEEGARSGESWSERLPLALTLLSSLGVVVYVGLRLAYSGFYDSLGVSPEEVGLGQVDLLVRSIGLIALVVIYAVALAFIPVLIGAALSGATGASRTLDWMLEKAPRLAAGVVIAIVVAWFAGMAFLPTGLRQYLFYAPLGLLILAALSGNLLFPKQRSDLVQRARDMISSPWWPVGLVAVSLLSAGFIATLVVILAPAAAHRVQEGRAYRDWSVPWRADPVTVVWLPQVGAKDPFGGHCLMYLGQANGIAVLYDVDAHRSVRMATASAVFLIDNTSDLCKHT